MRKPRWSFTHGAHVGVYVDCKEDIWRRYITAARIIDTIAVTVTDIVTVLPNAVAIRYCENIPMRAIKYYL